MVPMWLPSRPNATPVDSGRESLSENTKVMLVRQSPLTVAVCAEIRPSRLSRDSREERPMSWTIVPALPLAALALLLPMSVAEVSRDPGKAKERN